MSLVVPLLLSNNLDKNPGYIKVWPLFSSKNLDENQGYIKVYPWVVPGRYTYPLVVKTDVNHSSFVLNYNKTHLPIHLYGVLFILKGAHLIKRKLCRGFGYLADRTLDNAAYLAFNNHVQYI